MKRVPYTYAIFRIDKKNWRYINDDLNIMGYKGLKAIIPTIRILKKSKSNKNIYEEVPLLFNYGFMKMKVNLAFDRNYLNKVKKDIPGILSWLRSLETLHPKKKKLRIDNAEDFDDFSKVATISKKEVKFYKNLSKKNQIYSIEDITNLKIGDYITLRGYPFEGLEAKVDNISLVTKMVTVTIFPEGGSIVVQIPMENILYSIYHNYDEDKLMALNNDMDISQIEEGTVQMAIENKQY